MISRGFNLYNWRPSNEVPSSATFTISNCDPCDASTVASSLLEAKAAAEQHASVRV